MIVKEPFIDHSPVVAYSADAYSETLFEYSADALYSEADVQQVHSALRRAYRSFEKVYTSCLDLIDQCLVPSANMLLERGDYEHAVRLLKKGIALCGQDESGALVYVRKKRELRRYLQETYYMQGDYERAEKLGEAPGGALGE